MPVGRGILSLAAMAGGAGLLLLGLVGVAGMAGLGPAAWAGGANAPWDQVVRDNSQRMLDEGRQTFRFDTFGDEAFWGNALKLHLAIEGQGLGGVGPGVSPRTALAVGLKVDADALPQDMRAALKKAKAARNQGQQQSQPNRSAGAATPTRGPSGASPPSARPRPRPAQPANLGDLDDPATTLALLRLNAVVGLTGFFDGNGSLTSIGIQCALCHSTVDDSFDPDLPGIGHRLDGWANRDLNVGAIAALAPDLSVLARLLGVDEGAVRTVLNSWGPGKFDAELILDGKAFRPDGKSAATLIPAAFGLAGVNLHTYTGWGSVTHWNAFVANLEMHGQGTFFDPRLDRAEQFPIAARERFGHVRNTPDLITSKVAALHFYQLAIPAPKPPDGSFDPRAAERGKAVFEGAGKCASCHVPPLFTEPGWNMHTPGEVGIDDFQANRAPDRRYRTTPLKGLWSHQKGGFYHDGRFASLREVVEHYNDLQNLGLTERQKNDLVEYLKSI